MRRSMGTVIGIFFILISALYHATLGTESFAATSNQRIYYVFSHTPGPNWVEELPFNEQPGIEQHIKYMASLLERKILVMGGPFLDNSGGMAVIETGSIQEAEAIGRSDPGVRLGSLKLRVRKWLVPMMRP